MTGSTSTVKITLEIDQETNLDDVMAHLCLMQGTIPFNNNNNTDENMSDFSIHEGELALNEADL